MFNSSDRSGLNSFSNFEAFKNFEKQFSDLEKQFSNFEKQFSQMNCDNQTSKVDSQASKVYSGANNADNQTDKIYDQNSFIQVLGRNTFWGEKLLIDSPLEIIAGYLNLGKDEGWSEGFDSRIGATFTRYIFSRFLLLKGEKLHQHKDRDVVKKVMNAFQNIGEFTGFTSELLDGHRPTTNRVCYDSGVTGWKGHAISRMVGNLGSEYNKEKPFFEILINSARSGNDPTCQPFFVTLYANEKELDERRVSLSRLKEMPPESAHYTFYTRSFKGPKEFLKSNGKKIGPNSTRLLSALQYLQETTINAQKTGNCWRKQPMRCLLASLYLEFFSVRKELTPELAMKGAKAYYKKIQKEVAIPFAVELLNANVKKG